LYNALGALSTDKSRQKKFFLPALGSFFPIFFDSRAENNFYEKNLEKKGGVLYNIK